MEFPIDFLSIISRFINNRDLIQCRFTCKLWSQKIFQIILAKKFNVPEQVIGELLKLELEINYVHLFNELERIQSLDMLLFPPQSQIMNHPLQLLAILGNNLFIEAAKKYKDYHKIKDNYDRTLDYYTVLTGNEKCFNFVFDQKFNSLLAVTNNHHLLHHAIIGGNLNIVKLLVTNYLDNNKQYDFDTLDNQGRNILLVAASCNRTEIAKYLINLNLKINLNCVARLGGRNALQYAAFHGNKELFLSFYENAQFNLQHTDAFQRNALHYAYMGKNEEIIKILKSESRHLNTKDQYGIFPNQYPLNTSIRELILQRRKFAAANKDKYKLGSTPSSEIVLKKISF